MAILSLLKEVRRTFIWFKVFDTFITSMLIFLAAATLGFVFNFSILYATIAATFYFIIRVVWIFFRKGYGAVEEQVPELEWQLRTSAETLNKDNLLVNALRKDLVQSVKKVKPSYFLDGKSVALRLIMISFLSFLVVGSAFFNLHLDALGDIFKRGVNEGARLTGAAIGIPNDGIFEEDSGRDPYGEGGYVAELGVDNLELTITPEQTGIDLGSIGDPQSKDFSKTGSGVIPGAVGDADYVEKIKKEDEELSKNYLLKIGQLNSS